MFENRAGESSLHGAVFEILHCIICFERLLLFKHIGLHSVANRIMSIQKPRHVSTAQQSHSHIQKGRNFLCKNRLKFGCSNYIKIFVKKSCFFKAYKRLSLKSYAKESSLYGAISPVLYFCNSPGQSSQFTHFLLLSKSVWSEIACKKNTPYSFCYSY